MPRSPEEANKAADKLKLEGDDRTAFVTRLTAGYVAEPAPAAAPPPAVKAAPAPKATAPAPKPPAQAPKYAALSAGAPPRPPAAKAPAPAAPRYSALVESKKVLVPITNEELGESEVLSNEALGQSRPAAPPPPTTAQQARQSLGVTADRPRTGAEAIGRAMSPPPKPANMADVRMQDRDVYVQKDTYFREAPAPAPEPNLGESEIDVPRPPTQEEQYTQAYDFLLSQGFQSAQLDAFIANPEYGAPALIDLANKRRGAK